MKKFISLLTIFCIVTTFVVTSVSISASASSVPAPPYTPKNYYLNYTSNIDDENHSKFKYSELDKMLNVFNSVKIPSLPYGCYGMNTESGYKAVDDWLSTLKSNNTFALFIWTYEVRYSDGVYLEKCFYLFDKNTCKVERRDEGRFYLVPTVSSPFVFYGHLQSYYSETWNKAETDNCFTESYTTNLQMEYTFSNTSKTNYITSSNAYNCEVYDTSGNVVIEDSGAFPSLPQVSSSDFTITSNPVFTDDMEMVTIEEVIGKRENYTIESSTQSIRIKYNGEFAKNILYDKSYKLLVPFISTSPPTEDIEQIYNNIIFIPCQYTDYYITALKDGLYSGSNSAVSAGLYSSIVAYNSLYSSDFNCYLCKGITPFYGIFSNDEQLAISFDWKNVNIEKGKKYYFYIISADDFIVNTYNGSDNAIFRPYGNFKDIILSEDNPFSISYAVEFSSSTPPKYVGDKCVDTNTDDYFNYANNITPSSGLLLKRNDTYANDFSNTFESADKDTLASLNNGFQKWEDDYYNSSSFDTSSLDGLFNSCSSFFNFLKQGFNILPTFIWALIGCFITVLIFLRVMGR